MGDMRSNVPVEPPFTRVDVPRGSGNVGRIERCGYLLDCVVLLGAPPGIHPKATYDPHCICGAGWQFRPISRACVKQVRQSGVDGGEFERRIRWENILRMAGARARRAKAPMLITPVNGAQTIA